MFRNSKNLFKELNIREFFIPILFCIIYFFGKSATFTQYLYSGMTALNATNNEVKALQGRLKSDGFFTGSVTGYFGSQTKSALEAYQKKNGLSAIGVVGPATRALLNKGI